MLNRSYPAVAALIAACSVPALTTPASAAPIPDTFLYQGYLEDEGVPANGMYDIRASMFLDLVGGTFISGTFNTFSAVEVVDGRFELDIDFSGVPFLFESEELRYMEIQVKETGEPGYVILEPRIAIQPAPIARVALEALHAKTADVTLQDAYDLDDTIFVTPDALNIRSSDPFERASLFLGTTESGLNEGSGSLRVYDSDGGILASLEQSDSAPGGWLQLFQGSFQNSLRLEPDFNSGGGGYFDIARNSSGSIGFSVDGNAFNTGSPIMRVSNGSSVFQVDLTTTGDASIEAPIGSINALEILDEPGVSESTFSSTIALTPDASTIDTILPNTINCPTSGYVLVIATAEVQVGHINGTTSTTNFGISSNPTSLSFNSDVELRIPSTAATGSYDHPVTVHMLLPCSAGSNTFYFLADQNETSSNTSVIDVQFTTVFIPTAYGTAGLITENSMNNVPDTYAPVLAPMNVNDIASEREQALQANLARQQRELETMRQRVAEIERLLKNANTPEN